MLEKVSNSALNDCFLRNDYPKTLKFDTPSECVLLDMILPKLYLSFKGDFKIELMFLLEKKRKSVADPMKFIQKELSYDLKKNYFDFNELIKDIENIKSSVKTYISRTVKSEWPEFDEKDKNNWRKDVIFTLHQKDESLSLKFKVGKVRVKSTQKNRFGINVYVDRLYYFFRLNNEFINKIVDNNVQSKLTNTFLKSYLDKSKPMTSRLINLNDRLFKEYNFDLTKFKLRTQPEVIYVYSNIINKSYINNSQANLLIRFKYTGESEVNFNKKLLIAVKCYLIKREISIILDNIST